MIYMRIFFFSVVSGLMVAPSLEPIYTLVIVEAAILCV